MVLQGICDKLLRDEANVRILPAAKRDVRTWLHWILIRLIMAGPVLELLVVASQENFNFVLGGVWAIALFALLEGGPGAHTGGVRQMGGKPQ